MKRFLILALVMVLALFVLAACEGSNGEMPIDACTMDSGSYENTANGDNDASAVPSAENLLMGKWHSIEDSETLIFLPDSLLGVGASLGIAVSVQGDIISFEDGEELEFRIDGDVLNLIYTANLLHTFEKDDSFEDTGDGDFL